MLDFCFFEGRGVTERDGIKGENEACIGNIYYDWILSNGNIVASNSSNFPSDGTRKEERLWKSFR